MRRVILFLLPTLVVLTATGLMTIVLRREALAERLGRINLRDLLESTSREVGRFDEATS